MSGVELILAFLAGVVMGGALDDAVGWVQQVLVNRRTGFVVDGHARVALALSRGERRTAPGRPVPPILQVSGVPGAEPGCSGTSICR